MAYALLKVVHLLSVIVWVGGMFFVLACLRPALAVLEAPPARVRLMHAALRRFFTAVLVAAAAVLVSGAVMIGSVAASSSRAGLPFNMPIDWHVMAIVGTLMVAIFGHIRAVLYRRLDRAVAAQDWPAGGAALASIRRWVIVNLVLGVAIVVVTRLGAAA